MTVVPFIERVADASFAGLHAADSYYDRHAYPAMSTSKAAGILVGGSDAPVDQRDPHPFVNMAAGMTRTGPGMAPPGPQERLGIQDVIAAYTINGARALGRDAEIGSIEPGKSADFIVLDRDIIQLARSGHADEIAGTKVLETWFRGASVYAASGK